MFVLASLTLSTSLLPITSISFTLRLSFKRCLPASPLQSIHHHCSLIQTDLAQNPFNSEFSAVGNPEDFVPDLTGLFTPILRVIVNDFCH